MRRQVASALILVALIIGVGIGYFGNDTKGNTTTQTVLSTYTITLSEGPGLLRCVVTEYSVWLLSQYMQGSYSTTTQSNDILTFSTTTWVTQDVGFTTVTTSPYTGTITGALARGNYTTCTYIPG